MFWPRLSNRSTKTPVRVIKRGAFRYCKELRMVQFSDGLEYIGSNCFDYAGLEEVRLPASVKTVGPKAFACCEQLRRVELNEGPEFLEKTENTCL